MDHIICCFRKIAGIPSEGIRGRIVRLRIAKRAIDLHHEYGNDAIEQLDGLVKLYDFAIDTMNEELRHVLDEPCDELKEYHVSGCEMAVAAAHTIKDCIDEVVTAIAA